ncbi:MAG: NAD-dependent deacylase [Flavobacteriales bacterium]|nr:NAD-dependent deacylase [Flavobacteriales bacterium]
MGKKTVSVLTGAGVSAESGIDTFRDQGGLWEKYAIEDVATPEAWARNRELVLDFYNSRWAQLQTVDPNKAHFNLVELEKKYRVEIITQNVDNLHERAGSANVLHLHGELSKCRSSGDDSFIQAMPAEGLKAGMKCPKGHQLRPHIVWFGEMVPALDKAFERVKQTDILVVIGTSLNVYPAAGLAYAAPPGTKIYLIDPGNFDHADTDGFEHIKMPATSGTDELLKRLL